MPKKMVSDAIFSFAVQVLTKQSKNVILGTTGTIDELYRQDFSISLRVNNLFG
jgi:hypothetical protein